MNTEIVNLLRKKYGLDKNDLEIAITRVNELEEAVKKIKGVEIVEDLRYKVFEVFDFENEQENYLGVFTKEELQEQIKLNKWELV